MKSIKEIAKQYHISTRTVRYRINKLQNSHKNAKGLRIAKHKGRWYVSNAGSRLIGQPNESHYTHHSSHHSSRAKQLVHYRKYLGMSQHKVKILLKNKAKLINKVVSLSNRNNTLHDQLAEDNRKDKKRTCQLQCKSALIGSCSMLLLAGVIHCIRKL